MLHVGIFSHLWEPPFKLDSVREAQERGRAAFEAGQPVGEPERSRQKRPRRSAPPPVRIPSSQKALLQLAFPCCELSNVVLCLPSAVSWEGTPLWYHAGGKEAEVH